MRDAANTIRVVEAANATLREQLANMRRDHSESGGCYAAMPRLRAGIKAVANLIAESRGVTGLHLSGDEATWEELQAGGRFEEWLREFDVALRVVEGSDPGDCGDCGMPIRPACHCAEHLRICEEQQRAEAAEASASHRLSLINELRDSLDAEEVLTATLRSNLGKACAAIDSFGFRSDDYGGTEDLASCIKKLGADRDEVKSKLAEREGDGERLAAIKKAIEKALRKGVEIRWSPLEKCFIMVGAEEEGLINKSRSLGELALYYGALTCARQAESGGGEKG